MNAGNIDNLYNELVIPRVREVMPGVIMIPLAALREFHDKAGMSPNELANYNFKIFLAGVGELQMFTYGPDSSETIPPMLDEVYYYDVTSGNYDQITASKGNVLYGAIDRNFYERKSFIDGCFTVNQNGRVYITVEHEKNIIANYYFDLLPDKSGCQFVSINNEYEVWIWLENDAVYVSNTVIIVMPL
ncbi:hypothetical protein IJV57_01695 [Candidatus Saccharibacteria bacterium]|nr:hypothetical protein [Candidatus Saccharibacteria bacterium]